MNLFSIFRMQQDSWKWQIVNFNLNWLVAMRLCLKSTLLFLVLFSSCASSRSKQAAEHIVLKPVTARFLSIPLQTPIGYAANDASVGHLDGDGEYDKPGPDEVKKFFPGDHDTYQ